MNRILIAAAAMLMFVSCGFNDAEFIDIKELAYAVEYGDDEAKSDIIPAEGGTLKLRIYSNGKVTLQPKSEMPEWAYIDITEFENDQTVTVGMTENKGFERSLELVAVLDGGVKQMELSVKQAGSGYIFCEIPYCTVSGSSESEAEYAVDTNLSDEDIVVGVSYLSGGTGWVSSASFLENSVKVSVAKSSESKPRKALLNVNLKGAADSCAVVLYLTQSSSNDTMGEEISFSDLRALATAEGVSLEQFNLLRGVVISDYRSKNMEQNPVLSLDQAGSMKNNKVTSTVRTNAAQVVDTTASEKTAYVQALDGSAGFRLVFDDPKENILVFGNEVTIDLGGTVLEYQDNPRRYTISGLAGVNVLESKAGNVVEKNRKISELTDEDIYTFVGLTDVEFPVKEGSYTDIRDNLALYSAVNMSTAKETQLYCCLDTYVTTLVDKDGDVICCPINMLCQWRRPSEGLPKGVGTAKGIITYNEIARYGDAGRYQLRVIDETGFAGLNNTSSNWETIASWDKGKLESNQGNLTIQCEKSDAAIADEHSYKSITPNTAKTCGISDTYRSIRVSSSVKGWYQWDGDDIAGYNGMLFNFPTTGISGDEVMLTFRFYAGRCGTGNTYMGYPSHWCVEYSVDGGQTWSYAKNGDLSGNDYVHLKGIATIYFTLNGFLYSPSASYSLGATAHSFTMPSEVFGKDDVRVRIRPYDNVMSSLYPRTLFDDLEHAKVTSATEVTDYVSFQDIILSYR